MRARRLDQYNERPSTDLYFVETQCAERHIKIGIAADIRTRISNMQVDCPYKIRLIKLVPDAAHLEKELHKRFSADRITGEWFKRSGELLDFIESL